MGRIDRLGREDNTLIQRHINVMLRHKVEYELVKSRGHDVFKTVTSFFKGRGICKQNFLKYYRRYKNNGENTEQLLPMKRGRKVTEMLQVNQDIINKIIGLRNECFNRYDISDRLKQTDNIDISSSKIYRLLQKLKMNQLNPRMKEEKRKIVKEYAGEMGHIDCHYLPSGIVKGLEKQKLYLVGMVDDYSRLCWVEVVTSLKSLDVTFATMSILTHFKGRYAIDFKEILSDNGSEFASRNNIQNHPFERMLNFYEIKHRYTKPFTPQTNGKIERFWKTIEEELLSGEQFDSLEDLKHHILGFVIYYNEHRKHGGIERKIPLDFIQKIS
jgi:transposase InsO family protein